MKVKFLIHVSDILAFSEILTDNELSNEITAVDTENETIEIEVSFNRETKYLVDELSVFSEEDEEDNDY